MEREYDQRLQPRTRKVIKGVDDMNDENDKGTWTSESKRILVLCSALSGVGEAICTELAAIREAIEKSK